MQGLEVMRLGSGRVVLPAVVGLPKMVMTGGPLRVGGHLGAGAADGFLDDDGVAGTRIPEGEL